MLPNELKVQDPVSLRFVRARNSLDQKFNSLDQKLNEFLEQKSFVRTFENQASDLQKTLNISKLLCFHILIIQK